MIDATTQASPQRASAPVDAPALERLGRHYTFRDSDAVRRFLADHADLLPLLVEARSILEDQFSDCGLILHVVDDPEIPDRRQLELAIITKDSPAAALRRLQQFDRSWWLAHLDRADGKLRVTVELSQPGAA